MIKFFLLFGLSYSLSLLLLSKNKVCKILAVKMTFDFLAVLLLGSIKKIDSGEIQTVAFMSVITGLLVAFLLIFLENKKEVTK